VVLDELDEKKGKGGVGREGGACVEWVTSNKKKEI
jgi:hypothetical protein